ncbi:glycosyltransferase [Amphritea sp.]|uniref:glycosyltransferase n=1 Tax=Amphritea sp. TaxID=1872502 RepID=UPI003A8DD740
MDNYDWASISNDPHFLIRLLLPLRGWFMLEIYIQHNQPSANVKLYLDLGDGFSEETSFSLPLKNGRVTKRLVYLPFGLKKMRLDPLETKGLFTIRRANLIWLTPKFARQRLVSRLINMHYRYREQTVDSVWESIRADAEIKNIKPVEYALERYSETFTKRPVRRGYLEWIESEECLRRPSTDDVVMYSKRWAMLPLISILMPTYNTDIKFLKDCINSVRNQSYQNWQLCIADDASTDQTLQTVLDDYAEGDSRISVFYRDVNGHISAASNSALMLASGEYVALLDHDDCLAPDALYRVVEALNENPSAELLYSDEDKIDELGCRFDPHFKPKWNYDLLLGQNYISHLTVLKTDLVKKVGGFQAGVEGSQDHDLLLRCIPEIEAENIIHLPYILYHWRAIEGSTASAADQKDYTSQAGLKAIAQYCQTNIPGAEAELGQVANTYRVKWSLPASIPLVSLLIPTRDNVDILKCCVDAILAKTTYTNFEVIILDNQTSCPKALSYLDDITKDSRVRVIRWDQPFNYSSINNFGVTKANGSIIGLVNNDIEPINPDWLDEMVSHVCRPDVGCVGAKLYYPNETVQHAGVILGIGGVAGHSHKYFERHEHGYFSRLRLVQELSAVTAACLLVRRSVFDEVGGLNEKNLAIAFNDVDFCLKVRDAGYRNIWTPFAELYHHESVSRGADDSAKKRNRAQREAAYMRRQWGVTLDNDPAYNPNLTLVHEDFSLR